MTSPGGFDRSPLVPRPSPLAPPFRIWSPDGDFSPGDGKSLSPDIRLSQFFERWFLPIVLVGRHASAATIVSYRESLAYWISFTGDPPLEEIDEFVAVEFTSRLHEANYKRGPAGAPKPMKAFTQAKHLRQIRAVLYRTGPTTDAKRQAKELLPRAPMVEIVQVQKSRPKVPFSLEEARGIAAAASRVEAWAPQRGDVTPPAAPPGLWWAAMIAALYYTGLRSGTLLLIRWRMLVVRRDGAWLSLPEEVVPKTHKSREKFLHPSAHSALLAMKASMESKPSTLIFDWQRSYSHFVDCHERLQKLAGIPPIETTPRDKWLSPQAWRRTHAKQMGRLGIKSAAAIAQTTLDHADSATTEQFYCDMEPDFIRLLPPLVEPQRRLF
jgi:integrase